MKLDMLDFVGDGKQSDNLPFDRVACTTYLPYKIQNFEYQRCNSKIISFFVEASMIGEKYINAKGTRSKENISMLKDSESSILEGRFASQVPTADTRRLGNRACH